MQFWQKQFILLEVHSKKEHFSQFQNMSWGYIHNLLFQILFWHNF